MQRKLPQVLLLLILLSFYLMCEAVGSDSGPLRVRSSPALDRHARVTFPKRSERVRRDAAEARARRKRSWILPGTLWCGINSKAATYDELGMFENADRCCREHDHCAHVIPSFTVNYGVFNSHFYTLSHCDCDQRFRRCLLDVNDTISSMVGYSFFNILHVPCFELTQQRRCTKVHWWGMCKVSKEGPYAIFKSPLPYNTSDVASKYGEDADGSEETSSERPRATERLVIRPRGKSPKNKHRCRSRDPPRGDTFNRRAKGQGCEKLSTVSSSRTHTTTAPMTARLLDATKSGELMSSNKRVGRKKSNRKGQVLPQVSTTTQSVLPSTQRQKPRLHPSAATETTTNNHKQALMQSRCCESRRGDTLWALCKNCLEGEATPETTTAATATRGSAVKGATQLKTKQELQKTPWNTDAFTKTQPKTTAALHEDVRPQEQMDSCPQGNNTGCRLVGRTTAQRDHEERSLRLNGTIPVADYQLLCGGLKHLDGCRFQIPPLEKKYDLQNKESKTVYHCECTTRLAVSIKRFIKRPSVLPTLLTDFVSRHCLKVAKEKKCQRRKGCFGGFRKASDLLGALKKMEERKNAVGLQQSGHDRKRGIPVRLYKRCLKLEREAESMAQLT